MTKPGNSDRDDSAAEADADADTDTDKADDTAPAADDAADRPDDSDQLMAELENAPPAPEEPALKKPEPKTPAPKKKERPVMPTARESAAEFGDKPVPGVIRWGFYLVLVAVAIGVFGGVYLLLNKETLIQSALEVEGREPITRAEADRTVTNAVWVLIVVNVIFGAFQALFAYKSREGSRRARMLVTIVTLMVVLFHYMLVPTLFGQLAGLIAAIGVALMFMPASRDFFPPRQPIR